MKEKYRIIWDIFSIGIVGLNSFLLLMSKVIDQKPLLIVVCVFTFLYVVTLLIESFIFKGKRNEKIDKTLIVLKVMYILIYLTVIMISIINCFNSDGEINKVSAFVYDAIMFFILLLNIPTKLQFKKISKKYFNNLK